MDKDKLKKLRDTLKGIENAKTAQENDAQIETEAAKLALQMQTLEEFERIGNEIQENNEKTLQALQAFKIEVPPVVVPDIKIPEINVPEVKIPQINVPEPKVTVNVPDVVVPEIKVPTPEVTVNVPEQPAPVVNVPETVFPENMQVTGIVSVANSVDEPIPTRIVDRDGNDVSLGGGTSLSGGGSKIGKVTVLDKDGQPVNPATEEKQDNSKLAFSTSALLGNGATYDSTVLDLQTWTQVQTDILSDVDGTIVIDFIRDSEGTDILRTLTIPYTGGSGYQMFSAPAFTPYVRYRFTADQAGQSDFYFDTKFLKVALSAQVLGAEAFISSAMTASLTRSILVGQNNKGDYTNVPVDGDGRLKTDLPKTAFGEVLVGQLSPVFQLSFEYTVDNTELTTKTITNGGTVTQSTAMAVMNTSSTTASTALLQSKREAKYRAGMGSTFRFTSLYTSPVAGCDQLAGLADETGSSQPFKNGYMIGYLGTIFGVHRFVNDTVVTVALASCDDPLDGSGTSGMTIDPTKINVFEIRFQYLGAGKIEFLVEDDSTGQFVVFHKVLYSNNNTVPSVYMPNFRATYWVNNGGTTSDITLKTASCGFFVEGKTRPTLTHQPDFSSGKQEKTGLSTEIAIFTIRNKSSYASKTNFIELWLLGITAAVEASGNALTTIRLIKNTTLGGTPSWADINTANSIVEIDTAGTTVTGGIELFQEVISGQRGNLFEKIQDWTIILDPGETLTVSASTSTGTATVDASLLWKELF